MCSRCRKMIYLVQGRTGEKFYVAHDGTRWCLGTAP